MLAATRKLGRSFILCSSRLLGLIAVSEPAVGGCLLWWQIVRPQRETLTGEHIMQRFWCMCCAAVHKCGIGCICVGVDSDWKQFLELLGLIYRRAWLIGG